MATLNSKSVLIIGGSSGIGYSVAKASLASHAALVIIASSNLSRVTEATKRLESSNPGSGSVKGEVVDATDLDSVKQLLTRVGEIDHLVFTSGDKLNLGFPDLDISKIKNAFDVRFWAPVLIAQAAEIREGGSITFTIGSAIVKPPKGWSVVAGVVGALDGLTRGLAVDLAPVRVNVVSPGIVDTDLSRGIQQDPDTRLAEFSKKLLLQRAAHPDEIAEAYLFLMKCTYITGQRIEVDGGYVLGA